MTACSKTQIDSNPASSAAWVYAAICSGDERNWPSHGAKSPNRMAWHANGSRSTPVPSTGVRLATVEA